jgi:uncharacterized membrane protein YeaQ/YmgE (transglycosylase-associated protein family)
MILSNESLLVILLVGAVSGWLAGRLFRGLGYGLLGNIVVGLLGAWFGSWLLPQIGLHLGSGIISLIVNATLGALVMLFLLSLLRGPRWGDGWGRRW